MCTRFTVPYKGGLLVGRNMDFGSTVGELYGEFPYGKLSYRILTGGTGTHINMTTVYARYSVKEGMTFISDGANKYVSVESLWLPETTFTNYVTTPKDDQIDGLTFMNWLLSGFPGQTTSISEIKDVLLNKCAAKTVALPEQFITKHFATVHFSVTEWKTGETIIIEIGTQGVKGGITIYEGTGLGVMTNSPVYPSQINNLRNYIHMTNPLNVEKANIAGIDLKITGNGNSLLGLPGSPLPSDRFARTAVLLNMATNHNKSMEKDEALSVGAALLNNVFVVNGTTSESSVVPFEKKWDQTIWGVLKYLDGDKVVYLNRDTNVGGFVQRNPDNK